MMLIRKLRLCLLLMPCLCAPAFAQTWPERPIRIVIPFATAGFADIAGRTIAQAFTESLGVSVIPDNRAGAGGMIGAEVVAKAAPDGYTLLLASNGPMTIGPALYPKVPYDPLRDFAPISSLGVSPIALVLHPALPAGNVKELIALLKARPGKVSIASPGVGTSAHLAGELFQILSGTMLVHVPYKGSGPALTDLMGGQVEVAFDPLSSSINFIKSGKLRALAVTTGQRSPAMPEIPTLEEAGVPGYEASTYVALLAPAGTPRAIINKLNDAAQKALASAAIRDSFARFATVTSGGTPEQLGDFLKQDLAKWKKVITEANVKAE